MTKPFSALTFILCCLLVGCSVHPISYGPAKYRWVLNDQSITIEKCLVTTTKECRIQVKKISRTSLENEIFQAFRIPGGAPPSNRSPWQDIPSQIIDARIKELSPALKRLEAWQSDLGEKLKPFPEEKSTNYEKLDVVCFDNNELWKKNIPIIIQKYSSIWWDTSHSISKILSGHFAEVPSFPMGVSVVTQSDWRLLMGESPYAQDDNAGFVLGVSPQHAEVFLAKAGGGLRLPNSIDWHAALQKNPKLCHERYWIKNGPVYFMSPKCNENKLRDRAPWVSIKVMKLAVMKDE